MTEPILNIGNIPAGVHKVHSDRVPQHMHVLSALRQSTQGRVLVKESVDLPTRERCPAPPSATE
jgi:hypothetical protein